MIAFDTNVLVRLLVDDDPDQSALARAALERAYEEGEECYLSDAVLCESAWVLASRYGAARIDVLAAITRLLAEPRYTVDDPDGVAEALQAFEAGAAEFSDYLIGARARRRGARTTYTFDRKLRSRPGFTVLRSAG